MARPERAGRSLGTKDVVGIFGAQAKGDGLGRRKVNRLAISQRRAAGPCESGRRFIGSAPMNEATKVEAGFS